MNSRIILSAVLAVLLTVGITYDAAAHGRGNRHGRARVVRVYPPVPRVVISVPPRYCAPPPVVYRPNVYRARPHYYSYARPQYRHHGNRHCR